MVSIVYVGSYSGEEVYVRTFHGVALALLVGDQVRMHRAVRGDKWPGSDEPEGRYYTIPDKHTVCTGYFWRASSETLLYTNNHRLAFETIDVTQAAAWKF